MNNLLKYEQNPKSSFWKMLKNSFHSHALASLCMNRLSPVNCIIYTYYKHEQPVKIWTNPSSSFSEMLKNSFDSCASESLCMKRLSPVNYIMSTY